MKCFTNGVVDVDNDIMSPFLSGLCYYIVYFSMLHFTTT